MKYLMVLLCLSLVNCAAKVVGFDNESRMVQVQAHDIPKANKAAEDFCHGPVKLLSPSLPTSPLKALNPS